MSERYPARPKAIRLSVTISPELARWTREEAKRHGVPISAVVAAAIRLRRQSELNAAMVAGLIEDREAADA